MKKPRFEKDVLLTLLSTKVKTQSYRAIAILFFEKIIVLSIAFEIHQKSLIQQRAKRAT